MADRHMKPLQVLVVDDEPDVAELIRMRFRRQRRAGTLSFLFAADGVEALEIVDEHDDVELVLTDLNMPRMDGLTLLRHLAEREHVLKTVVVSAYGDMSNIRSAMNGGAFDFLIKPIELDDLEATIDKCRSAIEHERRARFVSDLVGRYVSEDVVAALLDGSNTFSLGGERRRISLLMSDLRGFATLSEQMDPEAIVDVLNLYLGEMADIISRYGGTVNEFVGDSVLGLFGAPIQREDHALRAVACAVAMQQAMGSINERVSPRGIRPLEMGIGIHTGEVVVGNIGSLRRAKYGVVGSPVNLTSRIESYTVGGQVLISEHTLESAGSAVQVDKYLQMQAKGLSRPITLFAVDAVGGPYELLLPVQDEKLTSLAEPISLSFTILEGKYLTDRDHPCRIRRLSARGAVLETETPLERLADVRIDASSLGAPDAGGLFAKIMEILPDSAYRVRFTAIPEEIAKAIERVLGASSPSNSEVDKHPVS